MKKIIVMLIALALVLSMAACGNSGKNDASAPDTNNTSAAPESTEEGTEATETPEDTTEAESADTQAEDAAAVAELTDQIVGTWAFPGDGSPNAEVLTFNADGTGDYQSIGDKHYTFTYKIYIDHREYANGEPYTENMFTLTYDTGDVEDIIFFFTEAGKLAFHNSENGGYSGMIDNFDVYTKQ